jgi:hypothetical protein
MSRKRETLWRKEEDVPVLVRYLVDELESAGVGTCEEAQQASEKDGKQENLEVHVQGAAVAAPPWIDPVTPVKGKQAGGKLRLDVNVSLEPVRRKGPSKGNKCIMPRAHYECREVGSGGVMAQVSFGVS